MDQVLVFGGAENGGDNRWDFLHLGFALDTPVIGLAKAVLHIWAASFKKSWKPFDNVKDLASSELAELSSASEELSLSESDSGFYGSLAFPFPFPLASSLSAMIWARVPERENTG